MSTETDPADGLMGSNFLQSVKHKLSQTSAKKQEEGLSELYIDLHKNAGELLSFPSEIVPLLSEGFDNALKKIEMMEGEPAYVVILKRYLNAIMVYVNEQKVIMKLTSKALVSLLDAMLNAIILDDVSEISDWNKVRRGVNLVILKLLKTFSEKAKKKEEEPAAADEVFFVALFSVMSSIVEQLTDAEIGPTRSRMTAKCTFCINLMAKLAKAGFDNCHASSLMANLDDFLKNLCTDPKSEPVVFRDPKSEPVAFRVTRTIVDALAGEMGGDVRKLVPGESYSGTKLQKYVNLLLKGSPNAARRTLFDESPSTRSDDGTNDGSERVHLIRLQEILEKYDMDRGSSKARAQSGTSVIESSNVGGEHINKSTVNTVSSSRKEANASMKRAIALRERMARIRSGTAYHVPSL